MSNPPPAEHAAQAAEPAATAAAALQPRHQDVDVIAAALGTVDLAAHAAGHAPLPRRAPTGVSNSSSCINSMSTPRLPDFEKTASIPSLSSMLGTTSLLNSAATCGLGGKGNLPGFVGSFRELTAPYLAPDSSDDTSRAGKTSAQMAWGGGGGGGSRSWREDWIGANSTTVHVPEHYCDAFSSLERLHSHGALCDVSIRSDGQTFKAHRVVLAAASPYFNAMFTNQMRESRQDSVELQGVPARCMEALIAFAYSGKITIGEHSVQMLLPAAALLQIKPVVTACCDYLKDQLDCSNCLGIARFADLHGCFELKTDAERIACENYATITSKSSTEFQDLSWDQYSSVLASDELNVISEESLLCDVLSWLRYDVSSRQPYFHRVLSAVRLVLLPPAVLVQLGMEPEVRQCERCRDLIDAAKNYLLLPESRGQLSNQMTQPRRPRSSAVLYAVGGWCTGEALAEVERYDWPKNEWVSVASMSMKRCGVGLAAVGAFLYALGGHDGTHYLNSIERYDARSNTWSACPVSPTCEVRTSVGIGVIDSCIYAVGGQDGVSCLNMTEKYDTQSGQWTRVAAMSERRLGVAVVVLNGLLYAIGGADHDGGVVPLASAERYDPVTDRWQSIAPMLTKRKHHGAAPLNNLIYVAGGRDEHSELNTVECYNPLTNTWRSVASMNSFRSGVGLAVVNNRIFAVGGFNGTTYLRCVEFYEDDGGDSGHWTAATSMNSRRLGCGVAVVQAAYAAPPPPLTFTPMPGLS